MTTNRTPRDWQEGAACALGNCISKAGRSRWIARATLGGAEALRTRLPPGATPRLFQDQRAHLLTLLKQGAEAHGFLGEVWTQARIAKLIRREFGVSS